MSTTCTRLAHLDPEGRAVPRRGGDVIDTLDHQERSAAARPPFALLVYASAGRQVSDMDLRPALDRREDLDRRPETTSRAPERGDAFPPHQLGRWCVSETMEPNGAGGANPAARRDKDDAGAPSQDGRAAGQSGRSGYRRRDPGM